ncbi:MAG: two-component sensor histidine kinase [Flavobacteriaceae bacterium]|nr:two-component sensor histidine kinase [Flavobacteriaceae bacterium]|tara:strand:- start:288902 stop:290311 length:1410 start_codon:yes stop_codon:yes gene_type:complete
MILLVLLASVLILVVTIFQYDEQTRDYNIQRFERKETISKETIELELKNKTSYPVNTENLPKIFQDRIYEISSINKLNITIYDLKGKLLKTSIGNVFEEVEIQPLPEEIVNELALNSNHRVLKNNEKNGISYQTSYTYINDPKFKRIGILEIQFTQDNSEIEYELKEFITRLGLVYLLMFFIAIALAYFLSSYITRSIQTISDKMKETRLNKINQKIILDNASTEIEVLVEAYNDMIDQLEESAVKLARIERENAWREMAKQVAHEIKNPLTPMRLTVQNFQRKFNPEDPKAGEKIADYSNTLIQQIDVMSSIASAFSDFAKMPKVKKERIEVVDVVKLALEIFSEKYIKYSFSENEIFANLDKTQLIRIVTNLVKNAIQACKNEENPIIDVELTTEKDNFKIVVSDNGIGIDDSVKELVFEPKFTTKSSGMGLGLPMIKNIIEAYQGTITFSSKKGIGTIFTVILPKE